MSSDEAADLLARLDLRDYETQALQELLTLGRSTAPNLAEATGIPRARIYEVLDSLAADTRRATTEETERTARAGRVAPGRRTHSSGDVGTCPHGTD